MNNYIIKKIEEDEIDLIPRVYSDSFEANCAVFPNGPLWWFLAEGFVDRGEVFYEPQDQAQMHLVEMPL